MRVLLAGISAAVMGLSLLFAPSTQSDSAASGPYWIKIVFGVDGETAEWDGRVSVENGEILQMAEWMLEERDRIRPGDRSWEITTGVPDARRTTYAEPMRGVQLKIDPTPESVVKVQTAQGNVTIEPGELTPGRPSTFLNGRVQAEPLGTEQVVAETETDDDFTAIAVTPDGDRYVAWIAYDDESKTDHLLIRNVDDPQSRPEPIAAAKEFTSPHLFATGDGGLRAVWCSPGVHENWDLYTATRTERGWMSERLTSAEGTDFQLAADRGPEGTVWLAWQTFRNGNGDVYAKCLRDGAWSEDIVVTENEANEWQPAVSVGADGRAWIGYDTYEHGNYDVYLKSVAPADVGYSISGRIAIARSPDFEAHASVLADQGRVWVAYDAAGPGWGKDFRRRLTQEEGGYAEPLHASRRLELRLVEDGNVSVPADPLPQVLPPDRLHEIDRTPGAEPTRFYEYPQLARDGDGRMWLLFRQCRQGYCPHPPKGIDWKIYATTCTENGWLQPIQLPKSQGRQNQRVSVAAGEDGRLQCAWGEGNRFAAVDRKYVVRCGTLPVMREDAAAIQTESVAVDAPGTPEPQPQIDWTVTRGNEEFQLYFGDLHRHTNISRCSPTVDGCLTDAHRYALDAVGYDFLAITDHTRDVDPFSWWRTQKAADLFRIPGRYVPIYGYERSNRTPGGGHRNVFFQNRGAEVNRSTHWYLGRGLSPKETAPDKTLYPWMKKRGDALTAAHTPGYSKGAEKGTWTYNDPQVEPVAEIFQAYRRSYERPGSGVAERASLWYALRRGYKLGFIASSDHISTHLSYACVWAKDKTRKAIFEGLQSRRTYAATDRIGLDVRVGEALMGETVDLTGDRVRIRIRADGTAPIREIQVVRSGEVIARLHPGRKQVDTEYVDSDPRSGKSYYYVRLQQENGGLAWGSPTWTDLRK